MSNEMGCTPGGYCHSFIQSPVMVTQARTGQHTRTGLPYSKISCSFDNTICGCSLPHVTSLLPAPKLPFPSQQWLHHKPLKKGSSCCWMPEVSHEQCSASSEPPPPTSTSHTLLPSRPGLQQHALSRTHPRL